LRGILKTAWRLKLTKEDGTPYTHEDFTRATDWGPLRAERLPAGRDVSKLERQKITTWMRGLGDTTYGCFVRCVVILLFGAGLRADEVCNLLVKSYLPEERGLRFLRKGNREVVIPLGEREVKAVEAWLHWRKREGIKGPWMFVPVSRRGLVLREKRITVRSLEALCENITKHAEVKRFTPHDCRRTYCTALLDAGIDLATVQRLMTHKSPLTTARYDKRQAAQDAHARAAVIIIDDEEPPTTEEKIEKHLASLKPQEEPESVKAPLPLVVKKDPKKQARALHTRGLSAEVIAAALTKAGYGEVDAAGVEAMLVEEGDITSPEALLAIAKRNAT